MGVAAEERVDSLNEKDISGTVVMSKGRRKRKREKKKKKGEWNKTTTGAVWWKVKKKKNYCYLLASGWLYTGLDVTSGRWIRSVNNWDNNANGVLCF